MSPFNQVDRSTDLANPGYYDRGINRLIDQSTAPLIYNERSRAAASVWFCLLHLPSVACSLRSRCQSLRRFCSQNHHHRPPAMIMACWVREFGRLRAGRVHGIPLRFDSLCMQVCARRRRLSISRWHGASPPNLEENRPGPGSGRGGEYPKSIKAVQPRRHPSSWELVLIGGIDQINRF